MEFTPFKIVVAAIATLALLYIFFVYLSPYFLWPKDAQKQIESAILFATAKPGKAIEAENTVFENETSFSGNTFRAAQLETRFECNSASDCCDKGTECGNTIEWNEARVLFKQKKAIKTFARCESQHNIAACTVYFGQKPAQIKIVSTSALSEMDFSKENTFNIDLLVKNDGSVFAPSVFAKTRLFKLNQQKTTRELVLEKNSEETELNPREQKLIPINLEIELAANYIAEIRVEGENAGFDENSVEFSVIGTGTSLCKPAGKSETIFDSSTEKCEQNYYCSNCYYAFECKNAWQDAEPEKIFVDADPHHAMEITEPTNGACASECGDKSCNGTENCSNCPTDCGNCAQARVCNTTTEITRENNPVFLGKDCTDNIELLKKYVKQNGLEASDIDVLLVEALIQEESNCNAMQGNGKGLMQVDSCEKDNCSIEENINRGTQALNNNLETIKKQGISGNNAIKLALFSYKKGIASANKAIDFMITGKQLPEAMLEACYYFYDKIAYGDCYGFSREKCCNSYGFGAMYPAKILDDYEKLCTEIGMLPPIIQPYPDFPEPDLPADPDDVTVP